MLEKGQLYMAVESYMGLHDYRKKKNGTSRRCSTLIEFMRDHEQLHHSPVFLRLV